MAGKRSYRDRCGVARALDLVGERWAVLVVRELLLGPKRFTDLRSGLPHLTADVLAQRLRELEQAGIVRRDRLAPPAAARVYELTDWGQELEPVVLALGRWGSRAPFPASGATYGPDSAMLALKTLFDPSRAAALDATYEVRLGDQAFRARIVDGQLQITRGRVERADARIETQPGTLAAVLWHGRPFEEAMRAGDVKVEGSKRMLTRFLKLFPASQPVP